MFEYREALHLELKDYGNFEFRSREFSYSNSVHLMMYPKFVLVNKTKFELMSNGVHYKPESSRIMNEVGTKSKFEVSGY